ncbi:Predicted ester cyclase [Loktanella atrilutea]|uniref:Predicted ester cyclase n=1 Tax=Loktanella atrilutea TaxID=366533 RepID=A0A1M5AAH5_LOKAT|nr:ester cyclase [Loktanella atrilutea]SHF27087.1 Predicted ester cyclase [Loktanella atrilutea]
MTPDDLSNLYARYIACLNARDWDRLGDHVHADVAYNGTRIGLSGYRAMLAADVQAIPDLRFRILQTVAQPPTIAARLHFDCTPVGLLFDLPVMGRRVTFDENVFYTYADDRIVAVQSIIDKAAIAAQVCTASGP